MEYRKLFRIIAGAALLVFSQGCAKVPEYMNSEAKRTVYAEQTAGYKVLKEQKAFDALRREAKARLSSYWKLFSELGRNLEMIKSRKVGVLLEEDAETIQKIEDYISENIVGAACTPLLEQMYSAVDGIEDAIISDGSSRREARAVSAFAQKKGEEGVACVFAEEQRAGAYLIDLIKIGNRL